MNMFQSLNFFPRVFPVLGIFTLVLMSPRVIAATFTVTNAADSGSGSLRAAIINVNTAGAGTHTVAFNLSAPYLISITNPLPIITNSILINGATQPGYTGAPLVQIRCQYVTSTPGLSIIGPGGGIRALKMTGFAINSAINLNGISNRVSGCWIMSNNVGVVVNTFGRHALIGGIGATNRNVISANTSVAIQISASNGNNKIQGNYIGLDVNGTLALTGQFYGVVCNSPSNIIGGTVVGERNVISGFSVSGIVITGTNATANILQGNYIGIDAMGAGLVGNNVGVMINDASGNTIGGAGTESRNIISGNLNMGVQITGDKAVQNNIMGNFIGAGPLSNAIPNGVTLSNGGIMIGANSNNVLFNLISGNFGNGVEIMNGSRGNVLAGNIIGLDPSGVHVISNTRSGIFINESSSNTIGSILFPNIISGNGWDGIRIRGPNSAGNTLMNNRIGTDITGTFPRGNTINGIYLDDARRTLIGVAGAGNLIAANGLDGICLVSTSDSTAIHNNFIGVDATGTNALGNASAGIRISNCGGHRIGNEGRNIISGNGYVGIIASGTGISNVVIQENYIGLGTNGVTPIPNVNGVILQSVTGAGVVLSNNVISGNIFDGITLTEVNSELLVAGNVIGLSALGSSVVSNGGFGIYISGSDSLRIGGHSAEARNTIAGYGLDGILLVNSGSNAPVVIAGNYIGLSSSGASLPGWSGRFGVSIVQSRNIQVGGPSTLWRNVIGGNLIGLRLFKCTDNTISYNYIGTDPSAISARANNVGVALNESSASNTFANNIIAGNASNGIEINDASSWNTLRANRIGLGSISALPNGGYGIFLINARDTLIGGYTPADGNQIAYNIGSGVALGNSTNPIRNLILANRIYSNAIPEIDLGGDGITTNDPPPDADIGPNGLQNKPELFFASLGATNVAGLMAGRSGTLRIEFMAQTPAAGAIFLGATNLYVPPDGTTPFSFTLPPAGVPPGSVVLATATSEEGTSEFSEAVAIGAAIDSDGDLMPDWWEIAYGLNPAVSNAPASDADGDGISDLNEWIADTNPSDSNSYLHIIDATTDSGFIAYIPSSGMRRYNFASAAMSNIPAWTNVLINVSGTGSLLALPDATGFTQRIYRVEARLP